MINFDRLFREFWHFGAHTSELSNVGDYVKLNSLGKEIVLYNDGAKIIAFDNICPHRGARFFLDSRGNSMAVCKYHGLTIANGRVHMPTNDNYVNCPKSYRNFQVEICGSFVFFAIAPELSLLDQLGGELYDLIEAISFDCCRLEDVNEYQFNCNALVAVENALEPDHVPFVHSETLYPLGLVNYRNHLYGKNSIVKFDIGNEKIRKGLERLSKLFDYGAQRFEGYMSIHIFPFGFISSTGGYSYSIQNFFPSKDDSCNFSSNLYFSNLLNGRDNKIIDHFVQSTALVNRRVFDEDHKICSRIKYEVWCDLFDVSLSPDEIKIEYFRENLSSYKC